MLLYRNEEVIMIRNRNRKIPSHNNEFCTLELSLLWMDNQEECLDLNNRTDPSSS